MKIQTLLITLIFSLCCFSAEAGSAPASSSTVQGVVLGFNYEGENKLIAYIEIDHSKEYIGKFKNVCAKKKQIWAFGLPNKFTCTKFEYIEEAGDGPVYALELSAKDKIKHLPHAITLSLKPLRPYKPDSRKLELSEVQNLLSVYKSSSLKKVLQNAVKAGDVQILDIRKKSLSIYIIKWKHTGDEYSSNDYYYLVINRNSQKFFSAGNFEGEIVGFIDVNNDGIPEVQRSIGCDGTCEAITSIYKNTDDFVSVYNH